MEIQIKTNEIVKKISLSGIPNFMDVKVLFNEITDSDEFSTILLDLADLESVDTVFIKMLIRIYKNHIDIARKIRIIEPNKNVLELFCLIHIDGLYEILDSKHQSVVPV